MATMPGFSKSLRCPGCANTTLAEFYEPAGAVICPRCGLVFFRDSLSRIGAVQAKRDAEFDVLLQRLKAMNDHGADSLDFLELATELEEFGITIEDLRAANVKTLEDLKLFIARQLAIHAVHEVEN